MFVYERHGRAGILCIVLWYMSVSLVTLFDPSSVNFGLYVWLGYNLRELGFLWSIHCFIFVLKNSATIY